MSTDDAVGLVLALLLIGYMLTALLFPERFGWAAVPARSSGPPSRCWCLSAQRDTTDKVRALDAGADDYLVKPFAMDELPARLRAAARRGAAAVPEQAFVETAAFTVDLARSLVLRDGQAVHLTPTEWRLVEVLARHVAALISLERCGAARAWVIIR